MSSCIFNSMIHLHHLLQVMLTTLCLSVPMCPCVSNHMFVYVCLSACKLQESWPAKVTVYDLIAPQVPSPDSLLNLSVTRTYSQVVCLSAGATLAGRSGASSAHKTVTSHTIKRQVHPQLSPASHDHSTSDHRRGLLVPKSTFFSVFSASLCF